MYDQRGTRRYEDENEELDEDKINRTSQSRSFKISCDFASFVSFVFLVVRRVLAVEAMHAGAETTENFVGDRRNCVRHLAGVERLQRRVALRTQKHDFVAGIDVVDVGDVGGEHVHADRADDTRALAADEDEAAAFETAIEPVGVSRGNDRQRSSAARG